MPTSWQGKETQWQSILDNAESTWMIEEILKLTEYFQEKIELEKPEILHSEHTQFMQKLAAGPHDRVPRCLEEYFEASIEVNKVIEQSVV